MTAIVAALEINALKKVYKNGKEAVKNISLRVNEGDFFALLGPNGAGKSTTINIITGLSDATSGEVKIFGHDHKKEINLAKSYIGLVPQEFNFNQFELCDEILVNQAGFFGVPRTEAKDRAKELLKLLNIDDKAKVMARNLSGGMKRRLMIARALVHKPKLLILDEPTAGVDIDIRRQTWELLQKINEQGTTIILTTHYLEEAELLCKNIAIINHGEIIKSSRMDDLLRELQSESFILNLSEPATLDQKAKLSFDDRLEIDFIDDLSLEASITRPLTITDLFNALQDIGLKVDTLRNKSNRLEELFLRLTKE